MAYSIFLGTSKNRYELHVLELEENLHEYIFKNHIKSIRNNSRFYRMSDYYKDALFFYEDIEVLVSELDKLIRESNDSKFIDILISIKKVCVAAIVNKKNLYCFCD